MKSVHLQLPDDLYDRVNKAIGDVPRNRWIRRAIERALDAQPEFVPPSAHNALVEAARQGHPGPVAGKNGIPNERATVGTAPRSSSQAKRDVHPIPKKGER